MTIACAGAQALLDTAAWLFAGVTGTATFRCGARTVSLPIQSVDNDTIRAAVAAEQEAFRTTCQESSLDGFNARYLTMVVLHALAIDVVHEDGPVLWSADNTIQHFPEAARALTRMGLGFERQLSVFKHVSALAVPSDRLHSFPESPGQRVTD
jgi:hypothetical protein